jgi:pyruvate-ferredoxin/flavodoxin oxidoreductase
MSELKSPGHFPFAETKRVTVDGNTAAAHVAYLNSEVVAIYPITPSSPMGEGADEMASKKMTNQLGFVPTVSELQSEAGAAGAIHGALTAGAQAVTFTASQGLLLMIPNMYKIAAEFTPTVFHVSARSLSTHALSIFGDHSDIMSVRMTGFGLICSNNIQEIMDLGSISLRASLKSRLPLVHFFDGFRTSHEIQKIYQLPKEFYHSFIDIEDIIKCRERALDPQHADLRGTAQNPDLYFQGREAGNPYYDAFPGIFQACCDKFYQLTGRRYEPYQYVGSDSAEDVMVIMGSGADTAEEAIAVMNQRGYNTGILKIRMYRPFSSELFVAALPKTVKRIVVLDRTKEPGAPGEPLYMDTQVALSNAVAGFDGYPRLAKMPLVIGGRYGLSSKEFTPAMIKASFDQLRKMDGASKIWTGFTVGIEDDVTHRSLKLESFTAENADAFRAKFYGLGSDGTVGANKNSIKIIGEYTPKYAQGYFVYDSKKAGAMTISHLRFSDFPIRSTYLIQNPNFVAVHNPSFIGRYDVLEGIEVGGTLLLNTDLDPADIFASLPLDMQQTIIEKKLKVYSMNATKVADEVGLRGRINVPMQAAFFKISEVLPEDVYMKAMADAIHKSYGGKGDDVVQANIDAFKTSLDRVCVVPVPAKAEKTSYVPVAVEYDHDSADAKFIEQVILPVMKAKGDSVPVSAVPANGVIPLGTTKLEKRNIAIALPKWDKDVCIQCNMCSFVCPHATIRPILIEDSVYQAQIKNRADVDFAVLPAKGFKGDQPLHFRIQVNAEDCTGCGVCATACLGEQRDPTTKQKTGHKALTMTAKDEIHASLKQSYKLSQELPDNPESYLNLTRFKDVCFKKPYFEFSGACAGCGETPYIRLITQLYGDHMYVANATGCSSIYGGTMPTVPYTKNCRGEGVAWQSSLFEDNAEFGFGIRLAANKLADMANKTLVNVAAQMAKDGFEPQLQQMMGQIRETVKRNDPAFRTLVYDFEARLAQAIKQEMSADLKRNMLLLQSLTSYLREKILWIFGGDGWAYDIGYGGLDHVIACGENVNIMVLDTGVYSNTGGQNSKATPLSAVAKFAATGKDKPKKDLGLMAMSYKNAYVAQISYGANANQTLKAIQEAAEFPGASLVIAYSPCIEHGISMDLAPIHAKMAVDCGFFPLYRYDPRRIDQGLNPLQLDSKAPTMTFSQFMAEENRFRKLKREHPEFAETLEKQADEVVRRHYLYYEMLANLAFDKFKIA